MQVRKQHGSSDWFKIVKECAKAVYCNPAYLTICRVNHVKWWTNESQAEIKIAGKKSAISDIQNDTTLMAESKE